jgi:hypothetical protein
MVIHTSRSRRRKGPRGLTHSGIRLSGNGAPLRFGTDEVTRSNLLSLFGVDLCHDHVTFLHADVRRFLDAEKRRGHLHYLEKFK